MGRPWRIEFEGALYHVLSRGNDGKPIFSNDPDRLDFLELLKKLNKRFEIDLFAYVLMTNHYHLLLKTRRANLAKAMQWFGTTYTRRYNSRNRRRGHLFQGRYKSILVENETYLSRLSCYIHRNPLRAGLVKRLARYRWSSYPAYAYGKAHPAWLHTDLILSLSSSKDRRLAYRRKVQRYADEKRRIWEDVTCGFIYGSESFIEGLKTRFLPDKLDVELTHQRRLFRSIDPHKLAEEVAENAGIDLEYFKDAPRVDSSRRWERDMVMFILRKTGLFSNQQIGDVFNLSFSMVSYAVNDFRKKMASDSKLKMKVDTLIAQFKV